MGSLTLNNVKEFGPKESEFSIMLGHGFGLDQTSFHELTELLTPHYRVFRYDLSGSGATPQEDFSYHRYRDLLGYVLDLEDILNALSVKNLIYVGHSVNGMIGLLTSIRNPTWFRGLVLLGASPRYLNDPAAGYKGGFEQQELDQLYDGMRQNYVAWASGFSKMVTKHSDRPELAEQFADTLKQLRPDIAQYVAKTIFESDYRDKLEEVLTKTLILQTSNDVAVPTDVGDFMHRHIANSTLVQVDTEGHFPQLSAPKELADHIHHFISQL